MIDLSWQCGCSAPVIHHFSRRLARHGTWWSTPQPAVKPLMSSSCADAGLELDSERWTRGQLRTDRSYTTQHLSRLSAPHLSRCCSFTMPPHNNGAKSQPGPLLKWHRVTAPHQSPSAPHYEIFPLLLFVYGDCMAVCFLCTCQQWAWLK